MEFQTAQLRVKPRCIIAEGSDGHIFWATPSRARQLIDAGAAELVNAPGAGPTEQPAVGPTETKPMEPAEKKSSAAVPDGPSTDSLRSSEPGPAALSSASAPGLVSPQRSAQQLRKRGPGRPRKFT